MAESATGDKKLALEWLEGELSLIYAFLGHVETLEGLGQGERSVAEDMADVARQAQQVVDTIILNSLQERRRGRVKRYALVFKSWSDELRIARSTEMIKRQILGLFDSIERYGFGVFTDEVGVEAIPMDLNPVTGITVGSSSCTGGIRKFDEEIRYIQSYVEHMEAAGQEQISGRAKILMEQMREIIRIADGGIDPRRRFFKMEHVGVLIEDLRERMVAYDIGDAEAIRGFGGKPRIQLGKGLGTLYAKINRIKRDLEMMKALFDDVGLEEELGVRTRTWVGELKVVAQNIESVLDTYGNINPRGNDNQIFPILYNLKSRLKVEKQVNRIVRWIQILSTRRRLYRINPITRRRREWHQNAPCTSLEEEAPPPTYTVNLSGVIGIDESTHAVMDWILANDKHRRIVSIVGVEGTGKSTLARLVYDNETIRHHFVRRVWVDVPPGCSARQTFQDIRTRVMWMEYESGNEIIEESMGASSSSTDRSYLFVLDGVGWTGFGDLIEESFPDTAQGCRFILTTRSIDAAPHAGSKNLTLKLPLLTDDQSWRLFTLRFIIPSNPELMKLRKKILRSCGGLPLSILKLGLELSGVEPDFEAWSTVIERFNQYQIPWLDSSVISKFPLNLRRCLQYFEKFPIEDEIPARRLIALWVAEGLVRGGQHPPEDIAKRNLTELIDRNMIQVTERKLTREVKKCCLPVALRKLNLQEVIPRDNTFGVSHLADHLDPQDPSFVDFSFNHIHGDSSNLPDSALRDKYEHSYSFVSFDTREGSNPGEEIGNFLDRCVSSGCFLLLRVLDLERVFRPKLPKELGKLILLRYLGLRWTFLEMLPSNVSQLLSLQTLDIKHTYISELPSSIWKMEKLRHLYMNESYRCRFPARSSHASLKDLQTLWGVFIDEESPVKDGLDTLTNLKKLGLASRLMSDQETEMRSRLNEVADWVKNLHKLQSLRLKSYDEAGNPWDLPLKSLSHLPDLSSMYLLGRITGNELVPSGLPQSLTYLTLSGSGLTDDPMKTLRNLVNLRYLRLLSGSFAEKKMLCSSGGFLQLHVLKLWKLKELEELVVEEGALPKLRDLEIRSCESLKAVPIGLHKVSTLKELKLSKMPIEFTYSTRRAHVHYVIKMTE